MIDWNRVQILRQEVGPEDFDEIVDLFLEEVEGAVDTLRNLQDRSTLGEDLHFLKGGALSLGFAKFSDLCQAGETAAENGQEDAIDIQEITTSYDESKQAFMANLPRMIAA